MRDSDRRSGGSGTLPSELAPRPSLGSGVPGRVRLAIAHGDRDFRDGLRALLESEGDLAVVVQVDSLHEVTRLPGETPFDILVVYEQVSEAGLPTIGQLSTKVAVIVVADDSKDGIAMPAIRAGARAVVLNHLAVDGLAEAIRTVALGHVSIPPSVQAQVVADLRQTSAMPLTVRERDVTRLVAAGLKNGEIASQLLISEQTVKKHLNNIFQKLELRDRVELARYALRNALVAGDGPWSHLRSRVPTVRREQPASARAAQPVSLVLGETSTGAPRFESRLLSEREQTPLPASEPTASGPLASARDRGPEEK